MLLVAVIWYLLITSVLNIGQSYIEAYYGRSDRRNGAAEKPAPTGATVQEAIH
jgi:polar amino acid transport system permease protein